ncbi:MAG: DNA recombination protein RmuC [Gammaproteobacteria bacterium]|nr:DNA recombination protein RmuC [Gammaproteobacteria bacterium]
MYQNIFILLLASLVIFIAIVIWLLGHLKDIKAQLADSMSESREKQMERLAEMQRGLTEQFSGLQPTIERRLGDMTEKQAMRLSDFSRETQEALFKHRQGFDERQLETLKLQQDNLTQGMAEIRKQVTGSLTQYSDELGKRVDKLTLTTEDKLKEISGQVEKRLSEGFEKTTETFTDVLKRLALIDEAQKKITELSGNVVSLQEVLADKRSRGAFGEVQLASLVTNVMPENSFKFQHTLSNSTRVDCILFLPEPTGNMAIDSKFPLESYRKITDIALPEAERQNAERQFRQDIRKHIKDISEKYIIPGETSDGAVMFIPAEAVFAEIHGHYYDLVEEAQRARVWLVSPTTLMAVLTTARAVLKDSATRKQVHLIQEHLVALSRDFGRFQTRMNNLSKHIQMASKDVDEVNTSARKITSRFEKIEQVDMLDVEITPVLTDSISADDE